MKDLLLRLVASHGRKYFSSSCKVEVVTSKINTDLRYVTPISYKFFLTAIVSFVGTILSTIHGMTRMLKGDDVENDNYYSRQKCPNIGFEFLHRF